MSLLSQTRASHILQSFRDVTLRRVEAHPSLYSGSYFLSFLKYFSLSMIIELSCNNLTKSRITNHVLRISSSSSNTPKPPPSCSRCRLVSNSSQTVALPASSCSPPCLRDLKISYLNFFIANDPDRSSQHVLKRYEYFHFSCA